MNAVEIEVAISELALQPFDPLEFPFAFLAAFGNKETTLKRLRSGNSNASDIPGGLLQRNNIHIAVCEAGAVGEMLKALRASPATTKAKARFILASDGQTLEAEELVSGETIVCAYTDIPNHFGFLLPLADISTFKGVKDIEVDVRATGRLNKLYVELLRENPDWSTDERRAEMNHFMARLIFCFFAEDTGIFNGDGLFTRTVEQMSERDASNTHDVISEIFRAMNIKTNPDKRSTAQPRLPNWANQFPYVNGGLFSGNTEVPRFTRMARTYLIDAGRMDWKLINPDIFGSMIQAVADDEERGALGMHYTSVPNILKVLNPLFLDDLNAALNEAGDNERKLLNLRRRIARIRVFDPACGSGNFLVIAYKKMREIEAEINRRRGESQLGSEIPLTNFRGIELRDFPAEIARLALIIAEFQCDVLYRGQKDALMEFLPLDAQNWIVCGNALQLSWLNVCPPTGTGVKMASDDLFDKPLEQAEIDFKNEGGETYICGNPPYKGTKNQSKKEKEEIKAIFNPHTKRYGTLDYVTCWLLKAAQYTTKTKTQFAFVTTNSVFQGGHVPVLAPIMKKYGFHITFAHHSFKWKNLASKNAGVTVVVVGFSNNPPLKKRVFTASPDGQQIELLVPFIGPYLVPDSDVIANPVSKNISGLPHMSLGNAPYDGGNLILTCDELKELLLSDARIQRWIRPLYGSTEIIDGLSRYCIWIEDTELEEAKTIPLIAERISKVKTSRIESTDDGTKLMAARAHQFREMYAPDSAVIGVPIRSSENRLYITADVINAPCCITNLAYALYDAPIHNLAILSSRLHYMWISTVCGRMETRLSYSNKMGWNTFPVPLLTDQNKTDLTACAENILLARESHFPATIADLYEVKDGISKMPENLRHAHERNDETLERIYIGRRFKNDTERLEKLFELYTKMTAAAKAAPSTKTIRRKRQGERNHER